MSNTIGRNLILAVASMAVSLAPALAQGTGTGLRAKIPFAFNVGAVEYSAGTYEATVMSTTSGFRYLRMADPEARKSSFIQPINSIYSAKSIDEAKMVFLCADSHCSLAQMWLGN